ncbi:hypothetical protein F5Y18DRAFT_242417 [Xylariaceae sp. FL1019]|nr:hypothetical protein F5Y18DRAFT_242417 [Xylariaceae sp. FL1019]
MADSTIVLQGVLTAVLCYFAHSCSRITHTKFALLCFETHHFFGATKTSVVAGYRCGPPLSSGMAFSYTLMQCLSLCFTLSSSFKLATWAVYTSRRHRSSPFVKAFDWITVVCSCVLGVCSIAIGVQNVNWIIVYCLLPYLSTFF